MSTPSNNQRSSMIEIKSVHTINLYIKVMQVSHGFKGPQVGQLGRIGFGMEPRELAPEILNLNRRRNEAFSFLEITYIFR